MTFVKLLRSKYYLMEPWREISQKLQMHSLWANFFLKKVHEGVFKPLVLNCTVNRDACKRTCVIVVFMQHFNYFWLSFLGLFLGGNYKVTPLVITFDRDMLQTRKLIHMWIIVTSFKKC